MTIQLSDCCKATIDLDKTKERPECFTCSKCGRIIGSPLSTHNTREGIEEITWQDRFDSALEAPNTDGGFIYDLGEDYQGVDFDTDAIKAFIHQELQKARVEERERIKSLFASKAKYHEDFTPDEYNTGTIDTSYYLIYAGEVEKMFTQSELDQPTV